MKTLGGIRSKQSNSEPKVRKFNPEMLTVARRSRGLTQQELAILLSMQQSHLSKVEAGMLNPPDQMLEKLSRTLRYQDDFFYRSDQCFGIESAIIFHRMRKNISRKLLDKIEAEVNVYRMHIERLLRSVELNESRFSSYDVDEYGGPANIANAIRALWRLPSGPVKNLVRAVEEAGAIVIPYDFGTQKIDGLGHWVPPLPPIFFINRNIPGDRFRFSLAHEVGHIVMHTRPKPEMEKEANLFAAELLMPSRDIVPSLQALTLSKLADLKAYWKVAMAALIYRTEALKTLPAHKILYLRKQMGKVGYRTKEPVDIPREEPTSLSEVIEIYLREFGYTVPELCKVLSIYEDEFNGLYKRRHLMLAS